MNVRLLLYTIPVLGSIRGLGPVLVIVPFFYVTLLLIIIGGLGPVLVIALLTLRCCV